MDYVFFHSNKYLIIRDILSSRGSSIRTNIYIKKARVIKSAVEHDDLEIIERIVENRHKFGPEQNKLVESASLPNKVEKHSQSHEKMKRDTLVGSMSIPDKTEKHSHSHGKVKRDNLVESTLLPNKVESTRTVTER